MPFVVYLFALSAFALGLAEFVPIGRRTPSPGGCRSASGRRAAP